VTETTTETQDVQSEDKTEDQPVAKTETKPKAEPKPKAKAKSSFDVGKQSGTILDVPIESIIRYDNPRHEPENLFQMGLVLIGDPTISEVNEIEDEESEDYGKPYYVQDGKQHVVDELDEAHYVSLLHMATNKDYAAQYVELIDEYESVDRSKEPMAPQSIKELADDIAELGQLVPVLVRQEKNGYIGIDGGRRIAAILYLHAKGLCGEGKKFPATIKATTDPCKQGDVFLHSLKANLSRKDFTPLQEGLVYHQMLNQINSDTGKKWTMKEAAEALKVEYGTFRNRSALWKPYDPKTKKGLTDSQRQKVASGDMGVTAAARKALGEKHYSDGKPVEHRRKVLPLKKIEELFDESAEANKERRIALAECMGLDLKTAIKESEKRITDQEAKEARRA